MLYNFSGMDRYIYIENELTMCLCRRKMTDTHQTTLLKYISLRDVLYLRPDLD